MGPLRVQTCLILAVSSSVAEELLFRGALPLLVGEVLANLAFGLFHLPWEWGLRAWPILALGAGALFQGLSVWTGGLLAPTLAHGLLNFLVLYYRVGARPR
jgi:membrane protease YdiL (CAAX protease family)